MDALAAVATRCRPVSAAAAADDDDDDDDDDDGGGGGDDDDDDDNDNDDYYDDVILSRAPVNRGLLSIVGANNARWQTSRPIVRGNGFSSCGLRDLKIASRTSRTTLLALQVSAEQSVGWMTAMPPSTNPAYCIQIGPKL